MNQATISGRVGKDPQDRQAGSAKVAGFSVATSSWRKQDEKWVEDVQWHNVVCWNRLAEKAMEKVFKGCNVLVFGTIKYRKYKDRQGVEKDITEIVADSIECFDKKPAPRPPSEASAPNDSYDNPPAAEGEGFDDLPF